VRELQTERDPNRRAEIRQALIQLRLELSKLWRRYREIDENLYSVIYILRYILVIRRVYRITYLQ
jgi:hypothetical protein